MSIVGFILVAFGILTIWAGLKRLSVLEVLQSLFTPPKSTLA